MYAVRKSLESGVLDEGFRANIRCFSRETSVLTHLSVSGYGSGRHKQPKLTHSFCRGVSVGAPLRKTHWWCPGERNQQSNPAVQQAALISNHLSQSWRLKHPQLWLLISHLCP